MSCSLNAGKLQEYKSINTKYKITNFGLYINTQQSPSGDVHVSCSPATSQVLSFVNKYDALLYFDYSGGTLYNAFN